MDLRKKPRLDYKQMNDGEIADRIEIIKKRKVLPSLYDVERIISIKNGSKEEKNSYLASYIQKLETQLPNVQSERDIDIDTLQPKTRQRTLKKLETEAKRALWFAETFGLTPKSLTMTSKKGKNISIHLQEKEKSDVQHFTSMPDWWTNDLKNSRSVKRRLILEDISEADI
ncbi:unnamed protein product [Mytilus coruscus]|uniref:Uncharacterized protein n=1 Tax=Mytilus coruscus TaxID=42192 RepID=A0A6J8AHD2_MYTCO|nr:unnamed protein product [Mytilus coruscus]